MHSIKTDKRVTNIPESYLKEDELKVALFRRQNQKGNQTIVNEQFNKEFLDELNKMQELGVIKKVDKPTDRCHPIVVPKPNGDIRLCVDLTKLNAGVERELYPLESIEETLGKLGEECVFMSKVDANSGYWQVPLSEESQELTTFITPIGRFCCTRGPYGLSSMQEIFGKKRMWS